MENSISIIIPTKNEEGYLQRLLESIKLQTFQPAEIIVADNNSSDKTSEIAKLYECKVVQGGDHPGIGRNHGAAIAKSPLLLFLDADVKLPDEDFLRCTTEEFINRNLGVACCLSAIVSHNIVDKVGIAASNFYYKATEYFVKNGVGYCTFVLRNIHEQIGGYNEEIVLGEDRDYVVRASEIKKFGFLRSKKIVISLRRHVHEGRFKLMLKYFYLYAYLLAKRKVFKGKVSYSFKHNYPKDKIN